MDNWRIDCEQIAHQGDAIINLSRRIAREGHLDARDHLADVIERATSLLDTAKRLHAEVGGAL